MQTNTNTTYDMHATDIIGYTHADGHALCSEHGGELNTYAEADADQCAVRPIFTDNITEWADFYCAECNLRVCGSCGTIDDEPTTRTPWRECWKCHATVAYIDGCGYVWADERELARVTVTYAATTNRTYALTLTNRAEGAF